MFCSSTTLVVERKLSVSILPISSLDVPRKLPEGSPSGRMPSDTTVRLHLSVREAIEVGSLVLAKGALASDGESGNPPNAAAPATVAVPNSA